MTILYHLLDKIPDLIFEFLYHVSDKIPDFILNHLLEMITTDFFKCVFNVYRLLYQYLSQKENIFG